MSQTELVSAVVRELRLQGSHFEQARLEEFISIVWPLAADDPDAGRWAREFLASKGDLFYANLLVVSGGNATRLPL